MEASDPSSSNNDGAIKEETDNIQNEVEELKESLNVQFDQLGVIIINSDGSMSRISNWHELTKMEQVKALRLIAKRNKTRRKRLEDETKNANTDKESEPNKDGEELLFLEN